MKQKPQKPSEDLVQKIFNIIDCNSAWNSKLQLQIVTQSSIMSASEEIAKLPPFHPCVKSEVNTELLETLKLIRSEINDREPAKEGLMGYIKLIADMSITNYERQTEQS